MIFDFYRQPVQQIFEIIPFLQILLTRNLKIIENFELLELWSFDFLDQGELFLW